jgi:HlyD family secretion protein
MELHDSPDGDPVTNDLLISRQALKVVQVPTSALFRQGDTWAVYVIDGELARLTTVTIDHRTSRMAEVLQGLSLGDEVIVHPPDTLTDGTQVKKRAVR